MKAYKVTDYNQGSLAIPETSKYHRKYSKDWLVDMGLVFKDLRFAKIFTEKYSIFFVHMLWLVECAWLEPCFEISLHTDKEDLDNFHKTRPNIYTEAIPPMGTLWGFDIRLVRRVK